jgi:tRNA isopentenyl-2-thiomethyl-A-37 hydroxylase MiaE
MMEKVRVQEFYKIDDQGYQGTCTAIGLKNPAVLTGEQLDHFDRVRGWFDRKEVKNFKEANDRFKAEAVQMSAPPTDKVARTFDTITEAKATEALEAALNVLDTAAQTVPETVLNSFYGHLLKRAQSPEFQERLKQSSNGNAQAIEAEFTVENPAPALPASSPS